MSRTHAAEGYASGATTTADVKDNIHDVRQDITDLASSVRRFATEAPDMAQRSFETKIKRDPVQSMLWAAGAGFLAALLLRR
jgi:ElaB/YqjD/DUF883 family membrane-anchored ribosome-binding protein